MHDVVGGPRRAGAHGLAAARKKIESFARRSISMRTRKAILPDAKRFTI